MLKRKVIKITSTLKQHKPKIVSFNYCLLVKSTERTHKPDPHRPKVALFLWAEIPRLKRFSYSIVYLELVCKGRR